MIKLISKGKEFEVDFGVFPNSELYLTNEEISNINDIEDFSILWKYQNSEDVLKLYFLSSYLKQVNKEPKQLIISYLPYSRMDRVDSKTNNIFSLKYITNLINEFGYQVKVIEAHSDVSIELLKNSENINLSQEIFKKVEDENNLNKNNTVIMYPDEGAFKRYNYGLDYTTIYGEKIRDFKTGDILGLELRGKYKLKENAVIIDDISSKGTTFYKSAEKLFDEGFKNVYLVVTHCENTVTKGELLKCGVSKVYTTNSLLNTEDELIKKGIEDNKIEVFNLEDILKNIKLIKGGNKNE